MILGISHADLQLFAKYCITIVITACGIITLFGLYRLEKFKGCWKYSFDEKNGVWVRFIIAKNADNSIKPIVCISDREDAKGIVFSYILEYTAYNIAVIHFKEQVKIARHKVASN